MASASEGTMITHNMGNPNYDKMCSFIHELLKRKYGGAEHDNGGILLFAHPSSNDPTTDGSNLSDTSPYDETTDPSGMKELRWTDAACEKEAGAAMKFSHGRMADLADEGQRLIDRLQELSLSWVAEQEAAEHNPSEIIKLKNRLLHQLHERLPNKAIGGDASEVKKGGFSGYGVLDSALESSWGGIQGGHKDPAVVEPGTKAIFAPDGTSAIDTGTVQSQKRHHPDPEHDGLRTKLRRLNGINNENSSSPKRTTSFSSLSTTSASVNGPLGNGQSELNGHGAMVPEPQSVDTESSRTKSSETLDLDADFLPFPAFDLIPASSSSGGNDTGMQRSQSSSAISTSRPYEGNNRDITGQVDFVIEEGSAA